MTNRDSERPPQNQPTTPATPATIDPRELDQIAGGVAWRYWYYRAGMAIAGADPAGIASGFLSF